MKFVSLPLLLLPAVLASSEPVSLDQLLQQQKKIQSQIHKLKKSRSNNQHLAMNDEVSLDEGLDLEEEDPLADADEEDPFSDTEDDPLAGADEPAIEQEVAGIRTRFPSIKTSNIYRLATGNKQLLRRGFATGSDSENEDQAALVNAYSMKTKILYSEDVSFLLRFSVTFLQEYDLLQDRYTDDGEFRINEAYVKADRGSYNYKLGALIVNNGPLDFDSPSNILNMNSTLAIESFDLKNLKQSFIGGQYTSVSENASFSMTASALKPETAGTEYTRYLEEAKQRNTDSGEPIKDYSELSNNIGMRYQRMFSFVDIGVSAYWWFDKDTEISWTDASESNNTLGFSDTYSEKTTNLFFTGFDFDANLGSMVLKGEFYFFHNKNNYSYYKNSNNEKIFTTVQTDMFSGAMALEKVWGDLFIMGIYSYKELFDVPEGTNILDYENGLDNNTSIRNLRTQKGTIVARYSLSSKTKLLLTYSQSYPVKKESAAAGIEYEIAPKHELGFKSVYLDFEEHLATSSKLNSTQLFIDYKYHF